MEVSVFETVGLPEGCLLSVRAGNTRRQAPIPLSEPLRFPNLPFNAKQFKVDVLKLLGNARLNIDAAKEVESYTVDIDVGDNIGRATVGLTVKEEPSLCGKRAAELKQFDRNVRTPVSPSPRDPSPAPQASARSPAPAPSEDMFKAVQDTREYAKEHNIPNLVQEMLQHVLRERPAAPYSEMASYFRRLAAERGEVDLPPLEPSPLVGVAASSRAANSPPSRPSMGSDTFQTTINQQSERIRELEEELARARKELSSRQVEPKDADDVQRLQLEAEHMKLHADRAELLEELAKLDTNTCSSGEAIGASAVAG